VLRFCSWLQELPWVMAIDNSEAGAVVLEIIHYLSFFLLVGTIVFVDLRVLGIAGKKQSVAVVAEQFLPLTWTGLAFATLSGFILFAGNARAFVQADVFQLKIVVIIVAIIFGLLVQRQVTRATRSPDTSAGIKVLALVSLLLWMGAILASLEVAALTGLG
jgi:hypothetical protein